MWLPDGEKKFANMFDRFEKIQEHDGQTDGWTERHRAAA